MRERGASTHPLLKTPRLCDLMVRRWRSIGYFPILLNPLLKLRPCLCAGASSLTGGVRLERTCKPAMGYSFAAGTTDGAGAFDFTQGTTSGNPFWDSIAHTVYIDSRPYSEVTRARL